MGPCTLRILTLITMAESRQLFLLFRWNLKICLWSEKYASPSSHIRRYFPPQVCPPLPRPLLVLPSSHVLTEGSPHPFLDSPSREGRTSSHISFRAGSWDFEENGIRLSEAAPGALRLGEGAFWKSIQLCKNLLHSLPQLRPLSGFVNTWLCIIILMHFPQILSKYLCDYIHVNYS